MAHAVRHPDEQGHTCPVLVGGQGTGKNSAAEPFAHLWGAHYLVVTQKSQFTGNSVLDKLKIPRGGMHGFRHAHASMLIEGGANPKVTQSQMRHADARVTLDIYSHLVGSAQSDAVEKLGEILHPNCTQVGEKIAWIQ